MAAMLNWQARQIVLDDGRVIEKAGIVVRGNVATIRQRSTLLAERPGVVGVMPVTGMPNQRTVTFEDGAVWVVDRQKGCGCR